MENDKWKMENELYLPFGIPPTRRGVAVIEMLNPPLLHPDHLRRYRDRLTPTDDRPQ
jgi:hypothetical protein